MEKVFIFDMDGVIINSEPLYHSVELAIAKENEVPLDENSIQKYIGMRTIEVWESIVREQDLKINVKEILRFMEERKVEIIQQSTIQPIEGILGLLKKLKNLNYRIALASSSPAFIIETVLNKFNIHSYFECIVSGEEVQNGKPAPDIYLEVAKRLKVQPHNCIVLEDSKMGVKSGNHAGMKTIGFINPGSGKQDLSNANYVVHSIKQVMNYI